MPGFDLVAVAFGDAEDLSANCIDLNFAIVIFRADLEDAFAGPKIDAVDIVDIFKVRVFFGEDGFEELLVGYELVDGALAAGLSFGLYPVEVFLFEQQ